MPGRAGRNKNKDPFYYWNYVAITKPEAQTLASRLGLDFPAGLQDAPKSGLIYPIRRLITTGEDTPTNYTTLLGPLWSTKTRSIIKETRIQVLLCPPPGSPDHKLSEHLDAGSPRWTPRASNAEEEAEIGKVTEMKERVAGHMGERKDVETKDIKEILMGMGGNWVDNLPALEKAMNSTDQNVGR